MTGRFRSGRVLAARTAWIALASLPGGLSGCRDGAPTSSRSTPDGAGGAPSSALPTDSPSLSAASTADPANRGDASGGLSPDATRVTLLEPGKAPRRKLRYAWRAKLGELLTLELRTTASTETQSTGSRDVVLPTVHVGVAIEPRAVSPEGDLFYRWRVISAKAEPAPRTPSPVADGMRAEVDSIAHVSGAGRVSSRGLAQELTVDLPADAAVGGQMVEQVRQTLRDVAAPLPEEEVGVDARWRKLSQLDSREARITQTETFRLLEWEEDRGTLDDFLAQTAPPQPLRAPGVPPSANAHMDSLLASGQAKIHFDLTRLVPQSTFDGTTTMVLSGPSGDGDRTLTMVMHVGITLAGSRR